MSVAASPASPPPAAPQFLETPPPEVARLLAARLEAGEPVHLRVATDMADAGRYGERWLAVSDRRVLLLGPGDAVAEVPLAPAVQVRTVDLVGASRLEIEPGDGAAPLVVHYSRSCAAIFSEVAAAIRNLAKGEAPGLPTSMERRRCPTCGRLLPERDGICPFCIRKWDTVKRIAAFLLPQRAKVTALVVITLVTTGLALLPPYIVKHIIDDVLTEPPPDALVRLAWLVAALVGATLLNWGLDLVQGLLRADVSGLTAQDIRSRLYGAVQFLPLRFYDRRKVGNLISRFLQDADRLEMFLLFGVPFLLSNAMMLVGVLILLLSMNAQLTLYVLFPVPFIVVGGYLKWGTLRRLWSKWHSRWSRFNVHLNESIHGIRIVKAFAQEPRELRRFEGGNEALRDISVTAERSWFVFSAILNFVMSFGLFLTWYVGGRKILAQEMTFGALMAFIAYIWQLYRPLQFFANLNNFLTRAFAGAERIFEVLDAAPEPFEAPGAVSLSRIAGRVVFRDAWFGYDPGKPVLKGVDLEVEPGEMIGLVGKSGVGKSTLINLICRFYDVDRGTLEVDGTDVRDVCLGDLRRQIGLVAQEPFLFNGTLADNIAYGRAEASFEEIIVAARAANAHQFILSKPEGYDSLAGERGNKLSGGEKQRLAIARAILHDPRILILDEATSSVDTPTEKKLQEAIGRLVRGRTTFAIAHRLSTLRSADRLVVLDGGRVAEVGTHAELLAREGIFHRLVTTQQRSSAVIAVGANLTDGP